MVQVNPVHVVLALGILFGVGYALGWCNGTLGAFRSLRNREGN